MNVDRALVFTLLLTGACSAGPPETARFPAKVAPSAPVIPSPSVSASVSLSASAPPPERDKCPPVDLAALEPGPSFIDPRILDLAEVFPLKEIRAQGVAPRVIDLGRIPYERYPRGGDMAYGIGPGLGFPGLDPDLLKGDLSPRIAAEVGVWAAARTNWSEQLRGALLLEQRANLLRALPEKDDGLALRCATAARVRAQELGSAHDVAAREAATRIIALLEALTTKNAAETLLLGCLLTDRTARAHDEGRSSRARSIQLLQGLANDPKARRELRAHAAEQLAGLLYEASSGAARIAALRQVIALTRDPEQRVETLIKLASLAPGKPAEHEKQLEQILVELARRPADYRVAIALAELAQIRLERGAFALARDAAAQCARASNIEAHEASDPWGCAPLLASALAELGGAAPGTKVPLPFLGPLGLEIMHYAIDRLDRDEAQRAGDLLIWYVPEAAEGPQAMDLLISLTPDPGNQSGLRERRTRLYGPDSSWLVGQRARLAPTQDLPKLDQALERLVMPPSRLGTPPPIANEERRTELELRLAHIIQGCENELAASGREIPLRIDTTGSIPRASVSGASAKLGACLTRLTASRFRSVGPAKISVILFGE